MPVNHVRDADVKAISLVGKGANKKRFFLFKAEGDGEATSELGHGRLLKAEDWSTVYCVVAEPGWHEGSGIGGPPIPDVWASEEEIRKAAHRFVANGGLINKLHESLEPFGELAESVIALDDLNVNGEMITKGSWYIAINPTLEGKEAIEKGEFTGVSIEGTAVRELVEKGSTPAARSVGSVAEETLLQKIAKKLGMTEEEIEKADRTFGEIIAQREFDQVLPDALDAFRDAVWYAFFPHDPDAADPVTLITESCDEFKAWALKQLESVPVEKAERAEALGVTLDGSTPPTPTFGEDTMLTADEKARIEKLETDVAAIGEGVTKLVAKAEAETEPEAPTLEGVTKELVEVAELVKDLGAKVEKLGEGGSSQTEPATPVAKDEEAEQIRKAYEDEGVSSDLAGVL